MAMALLLAMTGCSSSHRGEEALPILTVSIEPMRFFAESIAGNLFKVQCMVPHGSNPETYEPVPRQLMDMAKSDAFLRVGPIGFEQTWIERLSEAAPSMQILDMSEGVEFIMEEEEHHVGHSHAGGCEPHIWTSPRNARIIATNIYKALCHLAPSDSALFRQRWEQLDSMIVCTDDMIRSVLSDGADSTFLIYHPTLSYFARDYGLRQLCVEEGGKEPSPARLRTLVEETRRLGTRVAFIQREFDMRHAEVIAQETGCRLVVIDPLSYDWETGMRKVAQALSVEL